VTKRNQPNHIILDYFYSLPQRRDWQISSHSFNICQRVEKQVFLHAERLGRQSVCPTFKTEHENHKG
ncbi:MAG: hypothetical protein IJJ41_00245, partial [Clostridia bacterium]|nr:hypothetical protein [Clostridia bacterium]